MLNRKVTALKSWGKHFIICFDSFFVRIHFLMYGSYRINERKKGIPTRLSLKFKNGELNLYSCSVKIVEADFYSIYDDEINVMSDKWNRRKAIRTLEKLNKKVRVCDALLDQAIFAGVGNIIKNEVLFRIQVNPGSFVSALPTDKLKELVTEARNYCFDFYRWKKKYELKKHWQVYKQKICPRDNIAFVRKYMGNTHRLTFYCRRCQKLYK